MNQREMGGINGRYEQKGWKQEDNRGGWKESGVNLNGKLVNTQQRMIHVYNWRGQN